MAASPEPKPGSNPACDRIANDIIHGNYSRALSLLDGAPSPSRTEAERANLRGLAMMLKGDAAKSVASFDLALDLDPKLGAARMNRGVAFLRIGEYKRAASDLRTIWDDPTSNLRARAAYHLALTNDALKQPGDAEAWLNKALEVDPSLDDALIMRGAFRERLGDLQAAGKDYKAYLERHPDSVVGLLRFGACAQRAGFADTARTYLQKVVALAPGSSEAVEARKLLVMWGD